MSVFFLFFGIGALLGILYAFIKGIPLVFQAVLILIDSAFAGFQSRRSQYQSTHSPSLPKRKNHQ
jgi:membrane protein implicated in regulation of membrane protease activity